MRWTKNAPLGDAILYVDGKYPDKKGKSQMVVRPASSFLQRLVGSVLRLPDGPDAMKNTLRPCTMFGFSNSLKSLIRVYELTRKNKEGTENFGFADKKGNQVQFAKVGGRECLVLVRYLPYRKEYPAKKTLVFIDLEWLVPLRVLGYDWDDRLSCDYQFHNVDFDVTLRAEDFTPRIQRDQSPQMTAPNAPASLEPTESPICFPPRNFRGAPKGPTHEPNHPHSADHRRLLHRRVPRPDPRPDPNGPGPLSKMPPCRTSGSSWPKLITSPC